MSDSTDTNSCRRLRFGLFIGRLTTAAVLLLLPIYVMQGDPVSVDSLSSLTTATTTHQVEALLGTPSHIDTKDTTVCWKYTGFTWCIVTIEFGADGKFRSVEHDH
jgi:outer membrane protein assembly factor BamE (lipoprotein component of BamABCDE complex)